MKKILYFFIFVFLVSCSNRKEIVLGRIERFRSEEKEWNDLTKHILTDNTVNHKLGLLISPDELQQSLKDELLEKKIAYLTVGNNEDCQKVEYQKAWENDIGT
jgi:hypothetical protein